jgi:hypothetical protein
MPTHCDSIDVVLRPWRRAAREAGVSLRQLRRAMDRGDVPAWVIGGWTRVRPADVSAWLATLRRPVREIGPPSE